MILILSASGDISTDFVIDWLNHYKYPYYRLNSFDLLNCRVKINLQENELFIDEDKISLESINAVWYRKFGYFRYSEYYKKAKERIDSESLNQLSREFTVLLGTIFVLLKKKNWLTNPSYGSLNKLNVLRLAQEIGLKIPSTFITNNKQHLNEITKTGSIISKSISDAYFIKENKGMYSMYTKIVDPEDIEKLPDLYFPSLIQCEIKKDYEIRTFYLDGICYSMAVFSQDDEQTKIDFRKYNWDEPNRFIPYTLPKNISSMLKKLMKKLNLNSGSIDLIKSTDDNYYFLEVNPVGQYGMVSFPCNYSLNKVIAEYLIKIDLKK